MQLDPSGRRQGGDRPAGKIRMMRRLREKGGFPFLGSVGSQGVQKGDTVKLKALLLKWVFESEEMLIFDGCLEQI